jgi:hypothetical protein
MKNRVVRGKLRQRVRRKYKPLTVKSLIINPFAVRTELVSQEKLMTIKNLQVILTTTKNYTNSD